MTYLGHGLLCPSMISPKSFGFQKFIQSLLLQKTVESRTNSEDSNFQALK